MSIFKKFLKKEAERLTKEQTEKIDTIGQMTNESSLDLQQSMQEKGKTVSTLSSILKEQQKKQKEAAENIK